MISRVGVESSSESRSNLIPELWIPNLFLGWVRHL